MSSVFVCGFECGQLGSVGQHWTSVAEGTISTSTVRSGSRSLRYNVSATESSITCNVTGSTINVGRFYVRFATLPGADCYIAWRSSGTARLGVAFKQSDSKLYCATGSTPAMGATGVSVTTGVWYRVDFKLDGTVSAKKADAQVDGVALGQKTSTDATDISAGGLIALGARGNSVTGEWFFDDVVCSTTAGDYPWGAGFVTHFVPTADGSHNVTSAGDFKKGAAGTNITNSTTDSWQLVDDTPLDDTTPDTNDYIAFIADTGGGAEYVEHIFGPAGVSATVAPRAVEVIVAYHQASAASGNSTFKLNDNGTEDTIKAFSAVGATTTQYSRKHYATAPTGGAWTVAAGAGNFNNIRHRFGYSTDANPDQYFDCVMIEAEFPDAFTLTANPGTVTVSGVTAGLVYGKKLTANPGSITVAPESAGLVYGKKLTASPGAITATGETAGLNFSGQPSLNVLPGSIMVQGAVANLIYGRKLTANPGSVTLAGAIATLTEGAHLGANPGTITVAGASATLRLGYKLTALPGTVTITPAHDVLLINNQPEEFTLNFLIELIPAESSVNQQYNRRLIVDGEPISVREWSFREEKDARTGKLDVALADVSQRSLITRDSQITFEYGTVVNGVTTWSDALVETGQLDRTDYQISRQGLTPNDSFTLTTKPSLLVNLEKTPQNGYILYDPLKHEVIEADWPKIKDTKGNTYTPVFIQQYFLTLHEIMYFVAVTVCGFAGMETNIPDWYIGIVEFKAGEFVLNTLDGLIASWKYDLSTVKNFAGDDVLYIRDGTSGLPQGMPAPRRIGVANAKQIGMTADHNRADAILLTYIADLRSYDTFTVRTEPHTEESGTGDEFTRTITVDTYTDFFRVSNPDVPVRTILDSKDIDIYHSVKGYDVFGDFTTELDLIESSTEIFRYDDVGLLLSRHKTAQKRLPDADNSFTIGFIDALDELETITYKQHPFRPMRTYVANRSIVTNGLIFVDVDNTQLDQPFGQDANKVFQAGNVTDTQLATFGALRTYRETGKPLRNGRVRYHIIEIDQAAGAVTENYEEERDGDLGVKSTIQEPRQVYVLQDEDSVRTTDRILELHAGEAPVSVGIPLARRVLLQENVYPNTVALQIIGIDDTLTKGTPITAIGREQENLGDYIIEARTFGERARGDDGKPGEAFMVLEVRQAN